MRCAFNNYFTILSILATFLHNVHCDCFRNDFANDLHCHNLTFTNVVNAYQRSWRTVESARIECPKTEKNPPGLPLRSLRNLTVTHCLNALPNDYFADLKRLERVDLTNNYLMFVPSSVKELRNLRVFTADDNSLLVLNLGFYAVLKELRFSRNRIRAIHSLGYYGISEEVPLEVLYLDNNILSELSKGDLVGLGALKVLDLGHNYMKKVEEGSFDGLSKLERLYLRQNFFKDLPLQIFEKNLELEVLDLSFCELKTLSRFFDSNLKLKCLDLSGNKFTQLPGDVFHKLTLLEDLGLSNLKLEELPAEIFSQNPRLQTLDLSNNDFLTLPEATFQLHSLQYLNLSTNFLQAPSGQTFASTDLKLLDLSKNALTHLPSNLFNLPNLEELHLNGNQLYNLSAASFNCSLDSLKHLGVRDNRLVFLEEQFLASFLYLKEFELCGNIWDCKCLDVTLRFMEDNKIGYSRMDYFDGTRSVCVAFNEVNCVMNGTHAQDYYREYLEIIREINAT